MKAQVRIALIGDYSPDVTAHVAIPKALELASTVAECEVAVAWLPTGKDANELCSSCDGLWCVPGSPYENFEGALSAIRWARESRRPFLGTCGGFQHALIEYACNVLDIKDADHAESNPTTATPLISRLECSLVEVEGLLRFEVGSRVQQIYGRSEAKERYHCSFGLNPEYQSLLTESDLRITGVDDSGEARVVELSAHPFFFATLYQPERWALRGEAHPLISAFVQAAKSSSLSQQT